ncbi:MAG: hypothetical protein QOI20_3429 [Acidimicrobiaceae bacterium]|nr:hypothetical protein [Acidimicrobiaceae bacterium]
MLARRIPLAPPPAYEVRFHAAFIDEIAAHPHAEALLEEIAHDLAISEKHLRRGAVTKVASKHGVDLWRFKPNTDHAIRILYSPQGNVREVVMAIPRSTDYRASDLDAAIGRILGLKDF